MSRRRRASREPVFGSDSFLDVVANLVGVVLIIIVMVGARVRELPNVVASQPAPATAGDPDSVQLELQSYQNQVAELQNRLLDTLRSLDHTQQSTRNLQAQRGTVADRQAALTPLLGQADRQLTAQQRALDQVKGTMPPLRDRLIELEKAIRELEARPSEKKALRYHLPVSKPVFAGELIFECREGRVTFADLQALLELMKKAASERAKDLQTRWQTSDVVGPAGDFRLRYALERERSPYDLAFGGLPPVGEARFDYILTAWELVPVWSVRGEPLHEALATGSRLRAVIDGLDPEQVVLTFCVYPDSFGLFRGLRDYLFERGFVVAGRPLPPDMPIVGSRDGSLSRGQ